MSQTERITLSALRETMTTTNVHSRSLRDTRDYLKMKASFCVLEWLVVPPRKEEIMKIREDEKLRIWIDDKKKVSWTDGLFHVVLPHLLFQSEFSVTDKNGELLELYRAEVCLKEHYQEKWEHFVDQLYVWEQWIWAHLIAEESFHQSKDITYKSFSAKIKDKGSGKRIREAISYVRKAMDEKCTTFIHLLRHHCLGEYHDAFDRLNQEVSRLTNDSENRCSLNPDEWSEEDIPQKVSSLQQWADDLATKTFLSLIKDVLPPLLGAERPTFLSEPFCRNVTAKIMAGSLQQLESIMLYARLSRTRNDPVVQTNHVTQTFFADVKKMVSRIKTREERIRKYKSCEVYRHHNVPFPSAGDVEVFIRYYGDDPALLPLLLRNVCPDELKCWGVRCLLERKDFPWHQACIQYPQELCSLVSVCLAAGTDGEETVRRLKDRITAAFRRASRQMVHTLMKHVRMEWMLLLDPDVIAEEIRKGEEAEPDLWDNWQRALTSLLSNGWKEDLTPFVRKRYHTYWEYAFESFPHVRRDLDFFLNYARLGGEHPAVTAWVKSQDVQELLYEFVRELLQARRWDDVRLIGKTYVTGPMREALAVALAQQANDSITDILPCVRALGFRLIGIDDSGRPMSSSELHEEIRRHPNRFELDTELVEMSGVTWTFHLVSPGILEEDTQRCLSRAVIRGDIENEEVISRLMDDLMNL